MNNKTILLILLLSILPTIVVFFVISKKDLPLVGPVLKQNISQEQNIKKGFAPTPEAPVYNPPQEIKYDSSTDLKKELDQISPQVLDSDFK